MKRKILIFAIVSIIVFTALALTACGNVANGINVLTYDKKYVSVDSLTEDRIDEEYFIFSRGGVGTYYRHDSFKGYDEGRDIDMVVSYSITFKYYTDSENEVLYCFFDSFKFESDHNTTSYYMSYYYNDIDENHTWSAVFNFNKNFLMRIDTRASFYMTESFLKSNLPNFGK